jgi:hypothetical protein
LSQAFGSQHDARAERPQLALVLLFDQLPVDQFWMGLVERLARASPLDLSQIFVCRPLWEEETRSVEEL